MGSKSDLLRTLAAISGVKSATGGVRSSVLDWRKGWDSNPRYPCRYAGFQDRCLKPLGHPSLAFLMGEGDVDCKGPLKAVTSSVDLRGNANLRTARIGLPPPRSIRSPHFRRVVAAIYCLVDAGMGRIGETRGR